MSIFVKIEFAIHKFLERCRKCRDLKRKEERITYYLSTGRLPWEKGYLEYRDRYIRDKINNEDILESFSEEKQLPLEYGLYLDERTIEYPWIISELSKKSGGNLLDAGGSLNNEALLNNRALESRNCIAVSLEPEPNFHYKNGTSFVFGDLRDLPFKNCLFDEIVCISTLEHIGMDNSRYTDKKEFIEANEKDFINCAQELVRVLSDNGILYITVPFGKKLKRGWYQQFDINMLNKLRESLLPLKSKITFYKYSKSGWQLSSAEECSDCESFDISLTRYRDKNSSLDYDPDMAAAARAVALIKSSKS